MNIDSVTLHAWQRLFGLEPPRSVDLQPPGISGYSLLRRVVAGLAGVRLPAKEDVNTDVPVGSKTPISDSLFPLGDWDTSTRLVIRPLVITLATRLKDAERRMRGFAVAAEVDHADDGLANDQSSTAREFASLNNSVNHAPYLKLSLLRAGGAAQRIADINERAALLADTIYWVSAAIESRVRDRRSRNDVESDLYEASMVLGFIANDFRDEDLRHVDFAEISLLGVEWDEATRWPHGWRARIKRSSEELPLSPGTYRIVAEPVASFTEAITS